jgi:hypothetical protein
MSVTVEKTTSPLSSEEIRMFLRDLPEKNILLDDVEFSDKDIALAMKLTVANAITPISNLTDPNQVPMYPLLCGTCGLLLKSEGLRQLRNQLTTQDGNIQNVGMDEKEQLYMRWAQHFQEEFKTFAQKIKIQENMESIMGDGWDISNGLGSGYAYSARWYK